MIEMGKEGRKGSGEATLTILVRNLFINGLRKGRGEERESTSF